MQLLTQVSSWSEILQNDSCPCYPTYLLRASPDGWAVWGVVVSTRWWLLVDHCVLRNWDWILVRAVKGLISRAGMVSICPILWQRDVKLQQTKPIFWGMFLETQQFRILFGLLSTGQTGHVLHAHIIGVSLYGPGQSLVFALVRRTGEIMSIFVRTKVHLWKKFRFWDGEHVMCRVPGTLRYVFRGRLYIWEKVSPNDRWQVPNNMWRIEHGWLWENIPHW